MNLDHVYLYFEKSSDNHSTELLYVNGVQADYLIH